MKVVVDIVTGARTRELVGAMLGSAALAEQRIAVLQRHTGDAECDALPNVSKLDCPESALNAEFFTALLAGGAFDRVIIAQTDPGLRRLAELLESRELKKLLTLRKIFFTLDCPSFMAQYESRRETYAEQLSMCDVAVEYGAGSCTRKAHSAVRSAVKYINPRVAFFSVDTSTGSPADALLETDWASSFRFLFIPVLLLAAAYLIYQIGRAPILLGPGAPTLSSLVTVFLSILYEAFPFILIGIFVSSLIQVLIPSSILERIFSKNRLVGYLAALFAGVIFPVCDCATVPVTARLIRKGVPVPIAVTFYLAAPIVNPIVIVSTLYAFPGQPSVALFRVVLGLLVALAVGLILPKAAPAAILNSSETAACDCSDEHHHGDAEQSRLQSVLRHAASEFFDVGVYLIIGALISSVIQTFVPKDFLSDIGGSIILSVFIMMLASFILSICSTSDAFIARTFANALPLGAVMGFMVLGPMLDLKNVLLLLGNFKKRFVLKLVLTVSVVAFFILLTFTISI